MTEEFGISHRQLQILAILWQAGEPLYRLDLLDRFNQSYGESITDATLRSYIRGMDGRNLLARHPGPREPGSMGRTPTLYSPGVAAARIISKLLDVIFGDVLNDNPFFITLAVRHLERRRARVETASSAA